MITDYSKSLELFVNMAPDNVYLIDLNLIILNFIIKMCSASELQDGTIKINVIQKTYNKSKSGIVEV